MAKEPETRSKPRLDQAELNRIIAKHELFREGRAGGQRANLAHHDLSGMSFRGHDLAHADFTGAVLVDADFEGARCDYGQFFACDLRNANFRNASMVRADLRGACVRGASMTGADLTDSDLREGSFASYDPEKGLEFVTESKAWKEGAGGVDLRGATLSSAKLSGTIAINSNFEDANLSKAVVTKGDLSGANLTGANLAGADLSNCVLKNVNLRGAVLTGAMMDYSNLENVDMTGALTDKPVGKTLQQSSLTLEDLIKQHQLWLKAKGAEGKQLNVSGFDMRKSPPLVKTDLTMMVADRSTWHSEDFSYANLQAVSFKDGDMRDCNFTGADLRGSNFTNARLIGAKMAKTRLEPLLIDDKRALKTNFAGAMLRYVDLSGAKLREVNFTGADLTGANLTDTDLADAVFKDAIVENAKVDLTHPALKSRKK